MKKVLTGLCAIIALGVGTVGFATTCHQTFYDQLRYGKQYTFDDTFNNPYGDPNKYLWTRKV